MFESFRLLKPVNILLVGDLMLDTYTFGSTRRVSPEAPVLILEEDKAESRPGGAGNVALNLLSLGARVSLFSRVGDDREGKQLLKKLSLAGADMTSVLFQRDYPTIVKNRLIADGQQLLRIDTESVDFLPLDLEEALVLSFSAALEQADTVAISDYGKGLLTPSFLEKIIALSRSAGVPVVVDPKGDNYKKYRSATLIKPNLSEAYRAAKCPRDTPLDLVASLLFQETDAEMVMITRSHEGISLFKKEGGRTDFPVKARDVVDVTGAGDVVLSIVSLGFANGLPMSDVVGLANMGGAIAVETLGCVQVTLAELAERLLERGLLNKLFSDHHFYALEQMLSQKPFMIFSIDPQEEIDIPLLLSIQRLSKEKKEEHFVVILEERRDDEPAIDLLLGLRDVDFVILHSSTYPLVESLSAHSHYRYCRGSLIAKS